MKKFILLSLIILTNLSYSGDTNFIQRYNNFERAKLEMSLEEKEREIRILNKDEELQKVYLRLLYQEAEYRDYIENKKLDRDIKKAQIYYYYHREHRKYYYYDRNYRATFIN